MHNNNIALFRYFSFYLNHPFSYNFLYFVKIEYPNLLFAKFLEGVCITCESLLSILCVILFVVRLE